MIDGQIIAEEPARTLALGKAWQPTFEAKEFDEAAAVSLLQSIGNIGEYSCDLQSPDFFSFSGQQWDDRRPLLARTLFLLLDGAQQEILAFLACNQWILFWGLVACHQMVVILLPAQ